ncbi:MAG: SpoIVB peptidase [Clostridiales bacterium]|nr:SpoIVB peptidase [Clostridiales bacterium]
MGKLSFKKVLGIILALFFLLLNYSPYVQGIRSIPNRIQLFEGDTKTLNFRLPLPVKIEGNNVDVIKFNGSSLKDHYVYEMGKPLSIQTVNPGDVSLDFKLFGLIPIKQMLVKVTPPRLLYPGGNSIGVSLYTKGALLVGISEVYDKHGVAHNPALDAGLRPGDVIEKVNGISIRNAEHLSELVNIAPHQGLELEILRGNQLFLTNITPIEDYHDGKYRLGMWVRDSTAGVGTLTFYDPEKNYFGALGHAITDVDTGILLSIKNGEIVQSRIIDIKQGKRGNPGELKAAFSGKRKVIGQIIKNTPYGIYGRMDKKFNPDALGKPIPICYKDNVRLGPAKILSTIDEEGIKEFDVQIIKINNQNQASAKGMVIEIVDPVLLERTGGIVQGMSGSPIIQDGKIVGAITHVFVNDPKKGYGIFIEWMMEESNKIIDYD